MLKIYSIESITGLQKKQVCNFCIKIRATAEIAKIRMKKS